MDSSSNNRPSEPTNNRLSEPLKSELGSAPQSIAQHKKISHWALTLSALGVVFGDIGTSPLYALRECFGGAQGIPSNFDVMGALSLIFWTLLLVVSVKYVGIVMRTDNKGEGGILALTALVLKTSHNHGKLKMAFILTMGILGAALLYSDGIITPAISVLSAVEGLEEIAPVFQTFVVPISITILVVLFLVQSRGTSKVGSLFGPVLGFWFLLIGGVGLVAIFHHLSILAAVNPYWAVAYLISHRLHSVVILGSVFLAVTGAEVLYADLGHFGRKPITQAWFILVFPCLLLNYFGQGAIALNSTEPVGNLFFRLVPQWFMLPMVIMATAATVIASQAVISGAFSLARQSVQLGFWPRILIKHTSSDTIGQVYVPLMNWLLLLGTIALILFFKESGKLAAAYGIAVSATMLITSFLMITLARKLWKGHSALIVTFAVVFITVDVSFLGSNFVKIASGGWIVLAIATTIFTLMTTWIRGRKEMAKIISNGSLSLDVFVKSLGFDPLRRVEGIAVFLSDTANGVPRAMLHNLKHNKVLHEHVVILSVSTQDVPFVAEEDRLSWDSMGFGIFRMTMRFGFSESSNVPAVLSKAKIPELDFHPMKTTYFLGRDSMVISPRRKTMPTWMKHIYIFMSHNSLNATRYFSLPHNRVVELGAQNEL